MLILFKPWKTLDDLKLRDESWNDAYRAFLTACSHTVRTLIDNMQLLHECKDARDDHFAERASARRTERKAASTQKAAESFLYYTDDSEILDHLEQIDRASADKVDACNRNIIDCLQHVEQSGYFSLYDSKGGNKDEDVEHEQLVSTQQDLQFESDWESHYRECKQRSKEKRSEVGPSVDSLSLPVPGALISSLLTSQSALLPPNPANMVNNVAPAEATHSDIFYGLRVLNQERTVDVNAVIDCWSLNEKQQIAFRLVTDASTSRSSNPLRLLLSGAGGTGKSRVINAIKDYFSQRGQEHRFRLASFTGVAAKNIGGSTLHAAMSFGKQKYQRKANNSVRLNELKDAWEGVDFLFVDEYSMIGCSMLFEISEALSLAKEDKRPFGGMNVIFAGDFAQLPAIGQIRLYSDFSRSKSTRGAVEKNLLGRLLWLSLDKVVTLTEIMRRRSTDAEGQSFFDLLGRLREGCCTESDYELLCTRLATRVSVDWSFGKWHKCPIIVSDNASKDHLNARAVEAFALRTGRDLNWYYASDVHVGREIRETELTDHLRSLPSNQTSHRLGMMPLVIGMPVMLNTNYDVEGGVVNGSVGILKNIRFTQNEIGERHAVSCVIKCSGINRQTLHGFDVDEFVALADTVDIKFTHPYSNQRLTIKRTQLPIMPAFAMTAYKSQGQTLDAAMVDLQSCRGTEAPYVMVSRVRSLADLLILRPFNIRKICSRPSEEVRKEMARQKVLELVTLAEHGTDTMRVSASAELAVYNLTGIRGIPYADVTELNRSEAEDIQETHSNWATAVLRSGPSVPSYATSTRGKRKHGTIGLANEQEQAVKKRRLCRPLVGTT